MTTIQKFIEFFNGTFQSVPSLRILIPCIFGIIIGIIIYKSTMQFNLLGIIEICIGVGFVPFAWIRDGEIPMLENEK